MVYIWYKIGDTTTIHSFLGHNLKAAIHTEQINVKPTDKNRPIAALEVSQKQSSSVTIKTAMKNHDKYLKARMVIREAMSTKLSRRP